MARTDEHSDLEYLLSTLMALPLPATGPGLVAELAGEAAAVVGLAQSYLSGSFIPFDAVEPNNSLKLTLDSYVQTRPHAESRGLLLYASALERLRGALDAALQRSHSSDPRARSPLFRAFNQLRRTPYPERLTIPYGRLRSNEGLHAYSQFGAAAYSAAAACLQGHNYEVPMPSPAVIAFINDVTQKASKTPDDDLLLHRFDLYEQIRHLLAM
jgi:hypothetical protein